MNTHTHTWHVTCMPTFLRGQRLADVLYVIQMLMRVNDLLKAEL